ncbi:YobI family P-loop NTPase [Desertihabitans aurantiacus]|uniref:YobI family P-loop NTPase n=1 Tax=Desertihabitans aurantiacus TaxID=2282477 RepID=UPI000DF78A9E|nr:hypothetical protein [Desertihabitans aurantiacus]
MAIVASTATSSAAMPLESLTPSYDEGHHGTYLRRLEEAVTDPRNLNIALTGRYGAGKSSVLDQFQANHRKTIQRLAISTLAPGEEGESTTNRIQKEIVKQLLYGASEKVGKNSRFSKIAVLGRPKAFRQSAVIVICVGGLLYLLGWLPDLKWTVAGHPTWARAAAWVGAWLLASVVVSAFRMLTYGRFTVSDVSAGGAALTLAEKPDSFFDKYLDEIVHYFGHESKDIVLFEDLDRFEDPHIFEALRELNILLNEVPERRAKEPAPAVRWLLARLSEQTRYKLTAKLPYRWAKRLLGLGVPVRFVYAVRDSVFEKIDATPSGAGDAAAADGESGEPPGADTGAAAPAAQVDAAAAETLRANRTKFFDIVIPLVPFISHRNARDLLLKLLAERGITGIEPRLVNTVAQHCTDMRLMRNMCNEYLVFAERLLEPKEPNKPAPGMDASHLFALVAYKNFHLEDFENITRRDSDLDRLYELHQRLVRETIAAKDARKRALLAAPELVQEQTRVTELLSKRLTQHAELARRAARWDAYPYEFVVGSTVFNADDVARGGFWTALAQAPSLTIRLVDSNVFETLDKQALEVLVPEGLNAHRWGDYDDTARQNELDDIEGDIQSLRRADFAQLVEMKKFTLAPDPATPGTESDRRAFADLLTATLKSQLACDLVRRGYIDRNFSLYAAQFYGRFTGVDVANFMVQHVQTNTMAVDYDLSRDGAVANLLNETVEGGDGLEHTLAAYNIDIVNHLLAKDDPRAGDVVDNLITGWTGHESRTFLAAYLTSDNAEREKLAAALAEHGWREAFTYLVGDDDVPANARVALVSAAMCAFDPHATYDLEDSVREFITTNYRAMRAFTEEHPLDATLPPAERTPARLDILLGRAAVVIPKLDDVRDPRLRKLIVDGNRYQLTADNLRTVLGVSGGVSLDEIQQDQTVYERCLDDLSSYVAAVEGDAHTDYAIRTPETLAAVLSDGVEIWDDELLEDPQDGDVADLLALASPAARLSRLPAVPESTWPMLAAADRFRASLANLEAYRGRVGSIDTHLAALLEHAGTVHVDGPDDTNDQDGNAYSRQTATIAVLNATTLPTRVRVDLAASLAATVPLPVESIAAASDDLFSLLLDRGLVEDDETTFGHFRDGGWAAIGPAVMVSDDIATFLKPNLVKGMVAELLAVPGTSAKVGHVIVADVDGYVSDDDWEELEAVARYADARHVPLTPETVARIARIGHDQGQVDTKLMLRLLCAASPPASADGIVEVFSQLGKPYSDISRAGAKLTVDEDEVHDKLFKVLKTAGRISRGYPRRHYSATVL